MKKIVLMNLVVFLIAIFGINNLSAQSKTTQNKQNATIEVFYFHFSHRCATCQAVESESQKAIMSLYPTLYKEGKIVFKSINLDEKSNKSIAEKYKAEGQSLLVVKGTKRFDLTENAFLNARNKPEKLKATIKKTIDSLL